MEEEQRGLHPLMSTTHQPWPRGYDSNDIPPDYGVVISSYEFLIILLCPLVLLGNSIVVVSVILVLRSGREPRASYMCLGNIATADIINCFAVLLGLVGFQTHRNKYLCASQLGSNVSASLTSMMSICLIAIERFLYIIHGIKYDSFLTPARTGLIIAFIWIAGLCCGLLPVMLEVRSFEGEFVAVCEFIKCPSSVIIASASLAIPSMVITPILYTVVYLRVRKVAARLPAPAKIPAVKFRSILMVFLSSICFLLCWGPFIVASVIYKFYCEPAGLLCYDLEMAIVSPLACIGFANSLLNPLIYAWWHPPYYRALKRVLCPRPDRAKNRPSLDERNFDT